MIKKLQNGNIVLHREGQAWSLIIAIALVIALIIGYFKIPFNPDERWIYFIMIAPCYVLLAILLKHFLKPSAVFTASTTGIEFFLYNGVGKISLTWNQIISVHYKTKFRPSPAELFAAFKVKNGKTYKFNLLAISSKDRDKLSAILLSHNLKINMH